MHLRPSSRLVLRIGGWSLGILVLLLAHRLWAPTDLPPRPVDSPIPSDEVARGSDPIRLKAPPAPIAAPVLPTPAAIAPQTLAGKAAEDALKQSGRYASLGAALEAARYAVEKADSTQSAARPADFFAANPQQQFGAWFSERGLDLAGQRVASPGNEAWKMSLHLHSIERSGTARPAGARVLTGAGNRVTLSQPATGVAEWFENRAEGLEHGFTLATRPAGDGDEVSILLGIAGDLHPIAGAEQRSIQFHDETGVAVLDYRDLKTWDSSGREIPSRMEIRGTSVALVFADAGATYPITIDPTIVFVTRLFGDPAGTDSFGTSLAVFGNTALVGAPLDSTARGTEAGRVYVFVRSGSTWSLEQTLSSSDGAASDHFGTSVGLSADTALIGAPDDDTASGANAGSAEVWVRAGTTWSRLQPLTASDAAANDSFGQSVALSPDQIAVIGAPNEDNSGGANAGSAYVFSAESGPWNQQDKLLAGAGAAGDTFGYSVALSLETILVGAPGNGGRAHVFERDSSTWPLQQTLPLNGGQFGFSVALYGDTALVGAPLASTAYRFKRSDNSTWAQLGPGFGGGQSVALSGTTALVGAPGGSGSVSVWYENPNFEYQNAILMANDAPATTSQFGFAVAFQGTTGLVAGRTSLSSSGTAVYQYGIPIPVSIGDGGVSFSNTPISGNPPTASLRVFISPTSAANGAHWIIGDTGPQYSSGTQLNGLIPGFVRFSFTPYPGFITPTGSATTEAGKLTTVSATYKGIATHPVGQTVNAFVNATFSVTIFTSGPPSPFFQWKFNGVDISGATSQSYTRTSATSAFAGKYSVRVTFSGEGSVTSKSATLTILPVPQTITFDPLAPRVVGDASFALNATANSGLPVSYQLVSGPAELSGDNVTVTGVGTVTLRATRAATADYLAATPVDRSFQVLPGDILDTWRPRFFAPAELANSAISGPLADPGKDSVNVLLAFALNLDPKASDSRVMTPGTGMHGLPAASQQLVSGQKRLALEFVRRRAASLPGITYRVEFAGSLGSPALWSALDTTTSISAIDSTWERVVVTDSQPATPRPFGRLVVTQP